MKNLLQSVHQEIIQLRRRNEIMSAQLAVIDVFAAALGLRRENQGMSIDVAWDLQQKIEELSAEERDRGKEEKR